MSSEQEAVVAGRVEQGPDLARDGVVRWRCIDLQERIKREWGISLHERTVGKLLRRLAFRRLSVRLQPEERSRGAGACQDGFAGLVAAGLPAAAKGKPVEVWFMGEARVGQQATRPRAVRDHRRTSVYLFGAVCPECGVGAAVVLPLVNVEAMTVPLAEISRHVTEGAHAVLVLDQAG